MNQNATPSHSPRIRQCLAKLGALILLTLMVSQSALAQEALLSRYDQLVQHYEHAIKHDLNNSTPATRETLERVSQALADFRRANGVLLDEALVARRGRLAPVIIQEDPGTHTLQGTFPSTDTPLALTDLATTTSTLTITDTGTISDLDVSVEISHTWVGDLFIELEHTDTGTMVTLLDRPGVPATTFGCSDDDMDVLFDDESGGPDLEFLCTGTPWYIGDAPPVGSLSAFDGEDISGTWELRVTDNAMGDTGSIESWSLITPDEPDLSLDKICDADDDGTGSYILILLNSGSGDGTGIVVTDWLSPLITVTGSDASQGTFNTGSGVWTVGDLDAGLAATLEFDFTFDPGVPGEYLNHAEVTAANEDDLDSTPGDGEGDDYDECGFVVAPDRSVADFVPEQGAGGVTERGRRFQADLEVDKDVDKDTAETSEEVTYTISLTNNGPHSTTKVAVADQLPDCLDFISATADRGSYDETTGVWTVGSVKVDEVLILTLVASVTDACDGEVVNTAYVSASNLPDPPTSPKDPDSTLEGPFEERETLRNNKDEASFTAGSSGRVLDGTTFALGRNYPNPFNPTTMVPFSLAEASPVSIRVYDMLGREVAVLVDGALSAGVHEVAFEASALPTGVYLIRMEAAGFVQIQRVTLMK